MHIESIHIEGFRQIRKASFDLNRRLTTIVGENGTGKTTIGLALQKLFAGIQSSLGPGPITKDDWPFGDEEGRLTIKVSLGLTTNEVEQHLVKPLTPTQLDEVYKREFAIWLGAQGGLKLELALPSLFQHRVTGLKWGRLSMVANVLAIDPAHLATSGTPWMEAVLRQWATQGASHNLDTHPFSGRQFMLDNPPASNLMDSFRTFLLSRFKVAPEFRTRGGSNSRGSGIEDWGGGTLASVLLNLRIHRSREESQRYEIIRQTFINLFPDLTFEAVEKEAGASMPEVLFYEQGGDNPIPLESISAGTYDTLSFITSLVARKQLVAFLEHPEQHLHPHGQRFLFDLLSKVSSDNQIIVTTHSPYFVDPDMPDAIRRVWRTSSGSEVRGPSFNGTGPKTLGQVKTALRRATSREALFARAVVVLEEESCQAFLSEVAPKLGVEINSLGVSLVQVDGEGGFRHMLPLLDGLGIPHVALRDKPWGDNPQYPVNRFFSLSAPGFEQFMDQSGFADLRHRLSEEVGKNKVRVAQRLADGLAPDQVPEVFQQLLKAAAALATGQPIPRQETRAP